MQSKDEKIKQTAYGSTLIERGYKQKDINPKARYLVSVSKPINHKTEAEKAFKKYGIVGVNAYVLEIMEIVKKETNEQPK